MRALFLRGAGAACAALALVVLSGPARAGLFDDDEARRAILDLRAKVEQADKQAAAREAARDKEFAEQMAQLKRSLLDLNNQIEQMRAELARMRGNDEQLAREIAELQRRQKDALAPLEDRLRKIEPIKVAVDGKEFLASPDEKRLYEEAVAPIRGGDFATAITLLSAFQKRYPASGYMASSQYWLGNAQYGKRDYKEAITTFRNLINTAPQHPRAPEAMLAIANCQVELKDSRAARRTLDELVKTYPESEAAQAGRERIALLKP
jgi:tol-pal system protein YbgF